MGKRAPYLSGYFLLDRDDDFESGMEDRLRAQSLFFLSSILQMGKLIRHREARMAQSAGRYAVRH